MRLVMGLGLHSSTRCWWPALVNEVPQPRTHAPICTAMSAMNMLRNASVIREGSHVRDVADVHGRERCESV